MAPATGTWWARLRSVTGARGTERGRRGLEQLDRIARRVVEHDLPTSGARHDLVAEGDAGVAETPDLGPDVANDQMNAVPAPRTRTAAIRHRPPGGAPRPAEEQPEVAAHHISKGRRRIRADGEAEVRRVEGDGRLYVV